MKVGDLVKHCDGWIGLIVSKWTSEVLQRGEQDCFYVDVDWIRVAWVDAEITQENHSQDWMEGDWDGWLEVINESR